MSTAAVLAGEIDFSFANMTDALPQIEPDWSAAWHVTSLERSPTSRSALGASSRSSADFTGGERGTRSWPRRRRRSRSSARCPEVLIKMADDPDAKETMRKAGASTVKTTPEQFRAQIQQEMRSGSR
jgi:tripartite-type tricarboxylate transporter receptor subunit TctC